MKLLTSRQTRETIEDEDDMSRFCAEVCAYPLMELRIVVEGTSRKVITTEVPRPVRPCA